MSQKRKAKSSPGVYIPPPVHSGELFPWKGYWWKVQAHSPNGGIVTIKADGEDEKRGLFNDAVMVLECHGKTDGHIKREKRAAKRPLMMKRDGFRPVPIEIKEPSRIIQPDMGLSLRKRAS